MISRDDMLLLVEDSEDDVFLMQRAIAKASVDVRIQVAVDGRQALDYLLGKGEYGDRGKYPIPVLVFLDLKLPYVHGFEVLAGMREDPAIKDIPVVVLTSSPEERDRKRAEELGARAYLVKPPNREMVLQALAFVNREEAR